MKKVKVTQVSAEWCGPCKMLNPIMEEVKKEFSGNENVVFEKFMTDDHPEVATNLNIRGIPTLVYSIDGVEVDRTVGLQTTNAIKTKIENLLK